MNNLKVVLADDEKTIQNGISTVIEWDKMRLKLIGVAGDGLSAARMIKDQRPDILLTDIKMPGLNGLQLIEKVGDTICPEQCIILSGYGEFEFARKAMLFGVRHYILKPVDRSNLEQALLAVRDDILKRRNQRNSIGKVQWAYTRSLPFIKEQLLRESISRKLGKDDLFYFQDTVGIGPGNIRLLLVSVSGSPDLNLMNSCRKAAENSLAEYGLLTSTILLKTILVMVRVNKSTDEEQVSESLVISCNQIPGSGMKAFWSRRGELSDIKDLYYDCLEKAHAEEFHDKEPEIKNENLQRVVEYINENYDNEKVSLTWITKNIVFLNSDYLGKLFKKGTGMSFSHYLMNIRIERAKDYLLRYPSAKIYDCAIKHGFGYNQQYFSRMFKQYTGQTPSEFKRFSPS